MPQQNDYLISARMRPTSKEESKLPLVEVRNPPDLTLPKVEEEREREEGIAKPFPQEADTKGATRSFSKAILEEDPRFLCKGPHRVDECPNLAALKAFQARFRTNADQWTKNETNTGEEEGEENPGALKFLSASPNFQINYEFFLACLVLCLVLPLVELMRPTRLLLWVVTAWTFFHLNLPRSAFFMSEICANFWLVRPRMSESCFFAVRPILGRVVSALSIGSKGATNKDRITEGLSGGDRSQSASWRRRLKISYFLMSAVALFLSIS